MLTNFFPQNTLESQIFESLILYKLYSNNYCKCLYNFQVIIDFLILFHLCVVDPRLLNENDQQGNESSCETRLRLVANFPEI
jgi:hypothetical protein